MERPWLAHYPPNVDWHQAFEARPVYAALDAAAAQWPENVHLDFFGREFTYTQTLEMVARAAKGFQALGVRKGVKVGLFLPNCPQQVVSYFAVLKAGGTVVNYSPLYSEHELLGQIEDSDTDIMVTLDLELLYPKARDMIDQSRLTRLVVSRLSDAMPLLKGTAFRLFKRGAIATRRWDDRHVAWQDLLDNDGAFDPVRIDPAEDVAVLQYTGGTTGVPKGAMLTHANVYINGCQNRVWFPDFESGHETTLGALPFFHAFAMTTILVMGTMTGCRIVLHPKFELDAVVDDVIAKRPSSLPGVPTMFTALANHPRVNRESFASVRWAMSGGAPLPNEVRHHFEGVTGVKILEGYGLTECSPTATCGPETGVNKEGSIGLPLPQTDIVIVDRENPHRVLPVGETGEICIAGPQVMKGYWNNHDATTTAIVDGRLRSGDVGYMDADGYTFIIDRMKDLILVGGFNVFPRVVEEAIHRHPAVKEVTVIGIPDDYLGEAPKAFVVLKDINNTLDAEKLTEFLHGEIGKHEIPREIEFRAELPKTAVGKLSKKELVAEEAAKRETAGKATQ
ncbi:long-chain fatty acid--CoA ligase [Emcibacter sp. SYSU 3D8]|uniref:long-chain-fatty-acid--CoA ligase n=1 Tax=Emcibacter sp. SYSU 3D8 TaxID=3133969 RepID=UPI0031FF2D13